MASFAYTRAKLRGFQGLLDLREAGLDVRIALVMSNTTADTEEDTALMNGFTTLDEYDGASYARQACANQAANEDTVNNRAEFAHDVATFATLGVGTRQCVGMIYYIHVTSDADSVPMFYVDTGGFPFDGNGGNVTVTPNAEGAAQLT